MRNRLLFYFVVMTTVNSNNVQRASDVKKKNKKIRYYIISEQDCIINTWAGAHYYRPVWIQKEIQWDFFHFSLPFNFIMFNRRAPRPICVPFFFVFFLFPPTERIHSYNTRLIEKKKGFYYNILLRIEMRKMFRIPGISTTNNAKITLKSP